MERISIAVLDDNKTALRTVAASVESVFQEADYAPVIRCFESIQQIWNALLTEDFDLLLLDISVLDGDGIHLARRLRQKESLADIIFVSSREDKVFDALQVHPYGFIRKSKFIQDAGTVLESYIQDRKLRQRDRAIVFDIQGEPVRLNMDEILFIEGSNKVRKVYLTSKRDALTVNDALESLEQLLKGDGFLRVHKGYLVNCKHIRRIRSTDLLLMDDRALPVSRRKLAEVKESYFDYMRGQGVCLS